MKRVKLVLRSDLSAVWLGRASGTPTRIAAVAFAVLCTVAGAGAVIRFTELNAALDAARTTGAPAPGLLAEKKVVAQPASALQRVALARSAHHLNMPWAAILDELERHASTDVALLAIDPDAGQGRVRVELEARQLKSLVDFAQRLGSSSHFERVTLSKHELVDRDPAKPLRMSLDVKLARVEAVLAVGGNP